MTLDPNDARLTAYALGELDAREAALVEAELGQSPEAARALVEIRRTAELIREALKTEVAHADSAQAGASAELTAAARARIYAAADSKNGKHAAASHGALPARPVSPGKRMSGWLRRHKVAASAVAFVLIIAAGLLPALLPGGGESRNGTLVAGVDGVQAPSPYYLQDEVQYFPPGPEFTLQREQAAANAGKANSKDIAYTVVKPPSTGQSQPRFEYSSKSPQVGPFGIRVDDQKQSVTANGATGGGQLPPSAPAAAPTSSMHLGVPPGLSQFPAQEGKLQNSKDSRQNADSYGATINGAATGNLDGSMPGGKPTGSPGQWFVGGSGDLKPNSTIDERTRKLNEFYESERLAIVPYDQDRKKSDQSNKQGESKSEGDVDGKPAFEESIESLGKLEKRLDASNEDYARIVENTFQAVGDQPLSTFSIDVDTASYSNVRRFLNQGTLPPPSAVRIEELINYFHYSYAPPKEDAADPFAAHADVVACPWAPQHRLVRIGIKGREIAIDKRPACNLVFLVDVSGSMNEPNKLPLVKEGLRMLVEKLGENDSVAIVVYAGASGLALPSTNGAQKRTILAAIDKLEPGGSTNGASGIQLAYETAVAGFLKEGANRVILATDGDFNVGITDQGQLVNLIEEKAKSGVFLSVLGFGMGNLKDSTLEKLSDKGNGNYAYIDSSAEARKVLVEQLSGTLVTIAKDVKIQIEFNPAKVLAYRLIGYENRMLAKEDFNDDKKDAGEIGAGHTVTALYEVVPVGVQVAAVSSAEVDPLEYQDPPPAPPKDEEPKPAPGAKSKSQDLLMLKLRYKAPDGDTSKLLKYPVVDNTQSIGAAGDDCELAAAVAAFGMQLRRSAFKGTTNYPMILELAEGAVGEDKDGYRREFVELVKKAQALGR